MIAIGQGGENLSRFASWINENDRAAGRGGTGAVGGSKNLKAIVIKAKKKMPKAKDRDAFKAAHKDALDAINESDITGPRKGGLSVFGTNVLMNIANAMGALPTRNCQLTVFRPGLRRQRRARQGDDPGGRPHLPRLPGGLQEGSGDQGRASSTSTWRAWSTNRPGPWAATAATTTSRPSPR